MKRYGSVIGVKTEKLEEYKKLHADVWPAEKCIRDRFKCRYWHGTIEII